MAYQGSTAASSVANPPIQVIQPLSAAGFSTSTAPSSGINLGSTQIGSSLNSVPGRALSNSFWLYSSTDGSTTVLGSSYFTDGVKLGMRPGDWVFNSFSSSLGSTTFNMMIAVVQTLTSTSGSVDLGASTHFVLMAMSTI